MLDYPPHLYLSEKNRNRNQDEGMGLSRPWFGSGPAVAVVVELPAWLRLVLHRVSSCRDTTSTDGVTCLIVNAKSQVLVTHLFSRYPASLATNICICSPAYCICRSRVDCGHSGLCALCRHHRLPCVICRYRSWLKNCFRQIYCGFVRGGWLSGGREGWVASMHSPVPRQWADRGYL